MAPANEEVRAKLEEDISRTKKLLTSTKGQLTRAMKNLEDTLADPNVDKIDINDGLEELNSRHEKLSDLEYQMTTLLTTDQEINAFSEDIAAYLLRSRKVRKSAMRKLENMDQQQKDEVSSVGGGSRHEHLARLPKIELPKFSGKIEEFPPFWDAFEATVDKSELPDVTKFTYLKGLLEKEAKAVIDGLQLTAVNYKEAKDILKQRYNRKEAHIFQHVQKLLTLEADPSIKDNLSKLKFINDKVKIHIRSLEALDIHGNTYGVILTPLILSRLPAVIRMEWSRKSEGKESDLPYLLEFLESEIKTRERAETFKFSTPSNPEVRNNKGNRGSVATTMALHTVTSTCIFCRKSNHASDRCFHLKRMTEEDMKSAIQRAGVCFSCLRPGHIAKKCKENCGICGKGHHQVLCRKKRRDQTKTVRSRSNSSSTAETSDIVNVQSSQTQTDEEEANALTVQSLAPQTILQTARVKIQGQSKEVYCNILFDSGSDKTYIRSEMSRKLKSKQVGSTTHRVATFGGSKSQATVRPIRQIVLIDSSENRHEIEAIEVENICSVLQRQELPKIATSKKIQFAHVPVGPTTIDILVGLDLYWRFMSDNIVRISDHLVAQETPFGFVLSGRQEGPAAESELSNQLFVATENEVRNLWSLESMGIRDGETAEDNIIHRKFKETIIEEVPDIQLDHSDQTALKSIETTEVCEEMVLATTVTDVWIQPTRWGSFIKAVRVIGWVKRFIHNCRNQNMKSKESSLSQDEMSFAKVEILRHAQTEAFKEEMELLQAKRNIPKTSKLQQLSCYLDEEGLLRIKGRLDNSELSFDSKHPVVLPNCWISRLIVLDYHSSMKHAGVSTIINAIREKYWILNLRRIAKSVIKSCVPCHRLAAKSCNQEAGPLPAERVNKKTPFKSTGIDFAGPLYVSDDPGKYYICLFTCFITRAVHLELTASLSVEDFILAFRKFTARRGLPELIMSDNAKTFVSASCRLETMYGDRRPKWSFIAPRSPWRGGAWERMVRTVKTLIKRTVGKLCIPKSELDTLLAEVEFVINSRPITAVTDSPDDFKGITPNDFLMFHGSIDIARTKESIAKNNRRLQQVWTSWTNAYLKQLPSGVPHFKEKCSLKIGSIVLIHEDHIPRLQWPLGRVIELLPGADNKIRTVKLQTASGVRIRSVQRLHHLESVTPELELVNCDPDSPSDSSVVSKPRLRKRSVMKQTSPPKDQPRKTRLGRLIKTPTKLISE